MVRVAFSGSEETKFNFFILFLVPACKMNLNHTFIHERRFCFTRNVLGIYWSCFSFLLGTAFRSAGLKFLLLC